MGTTYVTVWYPNPDDPGDPFPADTATVYVYDSLEQQQPYGPFTTDVAGICPMFNLPDTGTFIIFAEKDDLRSQKVSVVDGHPATIPLYLEEIPEEEEPDAISGPLGFWDFPIINRLVAMFRERFSP